MKRPLCSYISMTFFVFVVDYGFAQRHSVHPNLTHVHTLNIWKEALSCCLVLKLHLLFVKCCPPLNKQSLELQMSVESLRPLSAVLCICVFKLQLPVFLLHSELQDTRTWLTRGFLFVFFVLN